MTYCSCVCSPVHKNTGIGIACELVNVCWQWKTPGDGREYTHTSPPRPPLRAAHGRGA